MKIVSETDLKRKEREKNKEERAKICIYLSVSLIYKGCKRGISRLSFPFPFLSKRHYLT